MGLFDPFVVVAGCDKCHKAQKHTLRMRLEANLFAQVSCVCQECGEHELIWMSITQFQVLQGRKEEIEA